MERLFLEMPTPCFIMKIFPAFSKSSIPTLWIQWCFRLPETFVSLLEQLKHCVVSNILSLSTTPCLSWSGLQVQEQKCLHFCWKQRDLAVILKAPSLCWSDLQFPNGFGWIQSFVWDCEISFQISIGQILQPALSAGRMFGLEVRKVSLCKLWFWLCVCVCVFVCDCCLACFHLSKLPQKMFGCRPDYALHGASEDAGEGAAPCLLASTWFSSGAPALITFALIT